MPHLGALAAPRSGTAVPDNGATHPDSVAGALHRGGLDRRSFLRFCGLVAAGLALPQVPYAQEIAHALETAPRVPVLWLNGQDCNGNIEALIRTDKPTPTELLLDHLSVNYVELLMAGSGEAAEKAKAETIAAGGYVLVVEGSIPTGAGGAYCTVGGHAFTDVVREAAANALAVLSVGTCASWGGLPAAAGGATGAQDVTEFLAGTKRVIRLPGCPVNPFNVVNTIVHYITWGRWPDTNDQGLPYFAYGDKIHATCPRLPHFREGRFVQAWGDEGHRKGWCLRRMGCRGPQTYVNCETQRFNGGTSFPIASGAPCFGCVNEGFWDVPGGLLQVLPGGPIRTRAGQSQGGGGGQGFGRSRGR